VCPQKEIEQPTLRSCLDKEEGGGWKGVVEGNMNGELGNKRVKEEEVVVVVVVVVVSAIPNVINHQKIQHTIFYFCSMHNQAFNISARNAKI